jgi:molybdopterin/thiamine biosynthesis adenylyltransferase
MTATAVREQPERSGPADDPEIAESTVRSLDESRVAIVGGTSGVGLATARELAALGVAHLVR